MTDTVIPMKRPLAVPMPEPVVVQHDAALERLVDMTNQYALLALDKTIRVINGTALKSPAAALCRVGTIGDRLLRSMAEIKEVLPKEQK